MAKQDFTLGKGLGSNNPSRLAANISSIYGGRTLQVAPEQVIPNPLNKYDISDIDELADVIALYGLLQPFVVKGPFSDGTYMLIGGERRWTAVKLIRQEYANEIAKKFDKVEIKVVGPYNMDAVDEQVLIIELNEQGRDMSKYRIQDVWELHRLYKEKQVRGDDMPKNIIKRISEKMGIGQRQVQKYVAVSDKMIPEMKEEVGKSVIGEEGRGKKIISINKAAAIAQLPKEKQEKVHEIIKKQGFIEMETINEIKNETEKTSILQMEVSDDSWEENENYDTDRQEMFLSENQGSTKVMEADDVFRDEVEVLQDDSKDFYAASARAAKEKKEKEFISEILDWLKKLKEEFDLYGYQKEAVKQIKLLADSLLTDE